MVTGAQCPHVAWVCSQLPHKHHGPYSRGQGLTIGSNCRRAFKAEPQLPPVLEVPGPPATCPARVPLQGTGDASCKLQPCASGWKRVRPRLGRSPAGPVPGWEHGAHWGSPHIPAQVERSRQVQPPHGVGSAAMAGGASGPVCPFSSASTWGLQEEAAAAPCPHLVTRWLLQSFPREEGVGGAGRTWPMCQVQGCCWSWAQTALNGLICIGPRLEQLVHPTCRAPRGSTRLAAASQPGCLGCVLGAAGPRGRA